MREVVWNFYVGHLSVSWYKELIRGEGFFEREVTSEYTFTRIYKLSFVRFHGQDTCTSN
jgi:hypothetical protein